MYNCLKFSRCLDNVQRAIGGHILYVRVATCRSGVIFVNFAQISGIILVFPLLTLNNYKPAGQILYFKLQTGAKYNEEKPKNGHIIGTQC